VFRWTLNTSSLSVPVASESEKGEAGSATPGCRRPRGRVAVVYAFRQTLVSEYKVVMSVQSVLVPVSLT